MITIGPTPITTDIIPLALIWDGAGIEGNNIIITTTTNTGVTIDQTIVTKVTTMAISEDTNVAITVTTEENSNDGIIVRACG